MKIIGIKEIEPLESKARCGEAYHMQVKIEGRGDYIISEIHLNHRISKETIKASGNDLTSKDIILEKKVSSDGTPWDYDTCCIKSPVIFAVSPHYNGQMTMYFKEFFKNAFEKLKEQNSQ